MRKLFLILAVVFGAQFVTQISFAANGTGQPCANDNECLGGLYCKTNELGNGTCTKCGTAGDDTTIADGEWIGDVNGVVGGCTPHCTGDSSAAPGDCNFECAPNYHVSYEGSSWSCSYNAKNGCPVNNATETVQFWNGSDWGTCYALECNGDSHKEVNVAKSEDPDKAAPSDYTTDYYKYCTLNTLPCKQVRLVEDTCDTWPHDCRYESDATAHFSAMCNIGNLDPHHDDLAGVNAETSNFLNRFTLYPTTGIYSRIITDRATYEQNTALDGSDGGGDTDSHYHAAVYDEVDITGTAEWQSGGGWDTSKCTCTRKFIAQYGMKYRNNKYGSNDQTLAIVTKGTVECPIAAIERANSGTCSDGSGNNSSMHLCTVLGNGTPCDIKIQHCGNYVLNATTTIGGNTLYVADEYIEPTSTRPTKTMPFCKGPTITNWAKNGSNNIYSGEIKNKEIIPGLCRPLAANEFDNYWRAPDRVSSVTSADSVTKYQRRWDFGDTPTSSDYGCYHCADDFTTSLYNNATKTPTFRWMLINPAGVLSTDSTKKSSAITESVVNIHNYYCFRNYANFRFTDSRGRFYLDINSAGNVPSTYQEEGGPKIESSQLHRGSYMIFDDIVPKGGTITIDASETGAGLEFKALELKTNP